MEVVTADGQVVRASDEENAYSSGASGAQRKLRHRHIVRVRALPRRTRDRRRRRRLEGRRRRRGAPVLPRVHRVRSARADRRGCAPDRTARPLASERDSRSACGRDVRVSCRGSEGRRNARPPIKAFGAPVSNPRRRQTSRCSLLARPAQGRSNWKSETLAAGRPEILRPRVEHAAHPSPYGRSSCSRHGSLNVSGGSLAGRNGASTSAHHRCVGRRRGRLGQRAWAGRLVSDAPFSTGACTSTSDRIEARTAPRPPRQTTLRASPRQREYDPQNLSGTPMVVSEPADHHPARAGSRIPSRSRCNG